MGGLVELGDDPTVDDAQRRGRILVALATCMAEKGYRATTVADIARVARVSKTGLYAHFHDKEDCLLELVSRATDKAAGRNGLALRRDVLDRYVTLLCETAGDLAARFPDEVRPVGEELVLAAVGGIHELMLARVERGQADRLTEDADVAAAVLLGLLERRA